MVLQKDVKPGFCLLKVVTFMVCKDSFLLLPPSAPGFVHNNHTHKCAKNITGFQRHAHSVVVFIFLSDRIRGCAILRI